MNRETAYLRRRIRTRKRLTRLIVFSLIVISAVCLVKMGFDRNNDSAADFSPAAPEQSTPVSDPGYALQTMRSSDVSSGTLVLVNAGHQWTAFDSTELASIYEGQTSSYSVRETDMLLRGEALDALNSMLDDFYSATGLLTINVVAGYRSYSYQEDLYNSSLESDGEDYTSRYLALPGCSEHHTGLAVDLGIYYSETGLCDKFDGTGDYAWFGEHSSEYGYVVRYVEDKSPLTGIASEPWHFRYVGIPHAYLMASHNLCLEEYLDFLRGYPYQGEHLFLTQNGKSYEIYYCEGLDVYVPTDAQYEVSGDNAGGFIVTVLR